VRLESHQHEFGPALACAPKRCRDDLLVTGVNTVEHADGQHYRLVETTEVLDLMKHLHEMGGDRPQRETVRKSGC
jgi:hypothetical protein